MDHLFRFKVPRKSKRVLVLPLAWLVLLLSTTVFSASSYAQLLTIKQRDASLKQILSEIEKQTGHYFLYDNRLVDSRTGISVDYEDSTLKDVMEQLFGRLGLSYEQVDNTITLTARRNAGVQQLVRGKVSLQAAETGRMEPATNTSIRVKETNKVATTDAQGQFSIDAALGNTLVFTYIGYQTREVRLTSYEPLDITLVPHVSALDEVIISGYGIKEAKENQVGSAYMVTAKELEKRPAQRVDRLLEGLVPGFEIETQDQNNSSVRSRYRVRVRGESSISSITSNEPLWIIDGVQIQTGGPTNLLPGLQNSISPLSFLNPDDIESIVVLKDASATTIYGANGSNGVILIETKKGHGKSRVNYSYRAGLDRITNNRFQVLTGAEYNTMLMDLGAGDLVNNVETDWYGAYFQNGLVQQHNISVSGSSVDGLSHYISAGLYDEKHAIIANNTKRYNIRTNIQKEFTKWLTFHFITGGSYNVNNLFNPSSSFFENRPNIALYNPDGSFALRDDRGFRIFNNLAEAEQNDNNQNTFAVNGNTGVAINIMEGLSFRTTNGLDLSSAIEHEYRSMQNLSGMSTNGYLRKAHSTVLNWISTNTLMYTRPLYRGELDLLAGFEAQETRRYSIEGTGSNFANDWLREISTVADDDRRAYSSGSDQSSMSYFGRVGYVWDKKYAFTASMRRDGDSNFGSAVQWANFAAAGVAWTVSNEEFWNDRLGNFLKFKVTYGNNGNARFGGNYARGIYSFDGQYGYDGNPGAVMTRGVNDVLTWETTNMFNTGIDFGFKNFMLAAEYYHNVTYNLIDNAIVSSTSGQRRVYQNSGSIQNTGLELVLSMNSVRLGPVSWSPRVIASANRNKVLELPEGLDRTGEYTIRREGYDSRSLYLIRWAGVDPRDGAPLWYDANDNITRVYNPQNRVIGDTMTPDFYGSFMNAFSYKGFSLSIQALFTKGGYAFSSMRRSTETDGLNLISINQSKNSLDYWKNPGDLALAPRLSTVSTSSTMNSTRFLHSRTHIRINNVSLTYTLKEDWVRRLYLSGASVYVQADNMGFWTPYQTRKDRNTYRNSFESWPERQVISLGAQINL